MTPCVVHISDDVFKRPFLTLGILKLNYIQYKTEESLSVVKMVMKNEVYMNEIENSRQ